MRTMVAIVAAALILMPDAARAHQFLDYFDFGAANLSARGYRMARDVAAFAGREPSCVIISSHLDALEVVEFSRELSARRAQAVATELVSLGIRPETIRKINHGGDQHARPTPDRIPEPLNRRVVVDVYPAAACTSR